MHVEAGTGSCCCYILHQLLLPLPSNTMKSDERSEEEQLTPETCLSTYYVCVSSSHHLIIQEVGMVIISEP